MAGQAVKARVFAEEYPAGRAWVYEVIDPALPEGKRLIATGLRSSWRAALSEGCSWVSRYSETKRQILGLLGR